jgi:hypothetical protein
MKKKAAKKDDKKFTFELGAAAKGLSPSVLQSTPTTDGKPARVDVPELPLLSSSSSSDDDVGVLPHASPKLGAATKGLSPSVLQSTPTTDGKPARVDVPELPLLSSSSSSDDDVGVLPHASPKVSTYMYIVHVYVHLLYSVDVPFIHVHVQKNFNISLLHTSPSMYYFLF